jgi:hypothetical protein
MLLGWALGAVVGGSSAAALTIDLDFSHDTYLFADPTARAAIEAAANDLSVAITSSLNVISTDVWQGSFQSTTATLDFSYQYEDPTTAAIEEIDPATAANNRVRVFVGSRPISNAATLGQGGPAGMSVNLQVTGFPNQTPTAVENAAGKADTAYLRGGGPVIGTLSGSGNFNGVPFAYDIPYGAAYGQLWFDTDSNNDGVVDSTAQLANYWHYDPAAPVAAGKNDLYSVALHELMHVLGIGASQAWNELQQGTTWLGSEASALAGGGANLVIGGHSASGKLSTRVSDGATQEASMDPSLTRGVRKELTWLDLAFLRDLGWDTIAPAEPGDFNLDGTVDGQDLALWGRRFGSGAVDAADGGDLLLWQRQFGVAAAAASAATSVPEPTAWSWGIVLGALSRRSGRFQRTSSRR